MTRPFCPVCNERFVAINYTKDNVPHYRTRCDHCSRKDKKLKPVPPQWFRRGYRKKPQCDHCGFKFKFPEQSLVYHVDGNLNNNDANNLKTVCQNCKVEVSKSRLPWKPSKVVPDF